HLPLQLELSDPFPDLPDLVLYFKIPDSSSESFDLRYSLGHDPPSRCHGRRIYGYGRSDLHEHVSRDHLLRCLGSDSSYPKRTISAHNSSSGEKSSYSSLPVRSNILLNCFKVKATWTSSIIPSNLCGGTVKTELWCLQQLRAYMVDIR
nr:hypothetical protein [Tanacetum cinerariifolium]